MLILFLFEKLITEIVQIFIQEMTVIFLLIRMELSVVKTYAENWMTNFTFLLSVKISVSAPVKCKFQKQMFSRYQLQFLIS